jgi:hypothetical protein
MASQHFYLKGKQSSMAEYLERSKRYIQWPSWIDNIIYSLKNVSGVLEW